MSNQHKEETIKTYNTVAPQFSESHFAPFWVDEFRKYKALINGITVLDIGCGAGRDAVVFMENGFNYTGIDASEKMLDVARQRAPLGVFKTMDFYHLTFPDNTFDGFWAAASFLHAPKSDIGKLLFEAKRIIKSEGVGFISLKEKNVMGEGIVHEDRYGGISRYFAFYERDEFIETVKKVDLEIIDFMEHQEQDSMVKTNWLCFFVRKH